MNYEDVAVLVPCRNEEATVAEVVLAFGQALPGCRVVVCDNASSDATKQVALNAGATVIDEPRAGKGHAIRRLFADVDCDCYVMVDGDSTYSAADAPDFVELVRQGVDMVVGNRVPAPGDPGVYRRGHRFGNWVLTQTFLRLFRLDVGDTLSGYRAMSRRFVKTFPSGAAGFEIEAELNAHAASVGASYASWDTPYRSRPEGSVSKLGTYRDGWRILRRNLHLYRDWRPSLSFSILAIPWLLISAVLFVRAFSDYLHTGEVPKFPSLIASVGCAIVGLQVVVAGLILQRVTRSRLETGRLAYLAMPSSTTLYSLRQQTADGEPLHPTLSRRTT